MKNKNNKVELVFTISSKRVDFLGSNLLCKILKCEKEKLSKTIKSKSVNFSLDYLTSPLGFFTLMYSHFTFPSKVKAKNSVDFIFENKEDVDYVLENFDNLIDMNQFFTPDTKTFLKSTKIILEDNKEYLIGKCLIEFLENAYIEYNSAFLNKDNENSKNSGMYTPLLKYLGIKSSEENTNSSVLLHEVLHGYTMDYNLPTANVYLNELVTQLYTAEYLKLLNLDSMSSLYDRDLPIVYMLAHLAGIDSIKRFAFDNDIRIIQNALVDRGANKSAVISFLKLIDYIPTNDSEKNDSIKFNNSKKLYALATVLYNDIFGKSFDDDIKFLTYLAGSRLSNGEVFYLFNKYLSDYDFNVGVNPFNIKLENLILKTKETGPSLLLWDGTEIKLDDPERKRCK